jgi:pimeloyl-ACP methyl ester carboxylesterase
MRRGLLVACCVVLLVACGAPIGVKHLGLRAVHEELTGNVLTAGRPSTASRIELQKRGLAEPYADDPAGTLAALHAESVAKGRNRDLLFALTELSFDHALHGGGREYYLASVLYAWDYLFGGGAETCDALDPRSRLAADLYNVGLARAFESKKKGGIVLRAGPRKLPFGTVDVLFDPDSLRWGARRLVRLQAASELSVHGLRNRYRTWGIGAPLNAATEPIDGKGTPSFVFPRVRVPVTLLLRPEPGTTSGAGTLQARLEVLADRQTVDIDGRPVPLEYEPTSAFAQALSEANPWRVELAGFLGGDLLARLQVTKLGGLEPYQPGKVPVVLVHGTASSAARWAEMLNDLSNDPEIRRHFQFWLFSYDTGNPILYSALQLREALEKAVHAFDPDGVNHCLRQMVVIGHSQGGLLAKLLVVESGDRFWRNVSDEPFDQVEMSPHTRDLLRRGMFVSPLPFVTEVVFIATPHRGSYQAGGFVRRVLQRLVNFPGDLARAGTDLLTGTDAGTMARQLRRLPTSVDNMAPGSPFVRALSSLPVAPGVSTHSIIPVLGDGPLEEGKDGVVAYSSAHIEPVDSELVVRGSGHSTQGDPRTIEEVRRILLEHEAAVFDGNVCRAPGAVAR